VSLISKKSAQNELENYEDAALKVFGEICHKYLHPSIINIRNQSLKIKSANYSGIELAI